ncbi:hypothetical protein QUF64_05810 [Anaerolineales bacterium HSG6]|nr:hypothetical protein [Anaerolineales bacterium HSG6]MDM8532961.1 hypothetical protein [Anaerolineales bacterium HSG25]
MLTDYLSTPQLVSVLVAFIIAVILAIFLPILTFLPHLIAGSLVFGAFGAVLKYQPPEMRGFIVGFGLVTSLLGGLMVALLNL